MSAGIPCERKKFLTITCQKDKLNGEADYDLNREDFNDLAPFLAMEMFAKPKKVQFFEAALKKSILDGTLTSEADLYRFCLTHAFLPKHATLILSELNSQGKIACDFRSPRRESLKKPRSYRLIL